MTKRMYKLIGFILVFSILVEGIPVTVKSAQGDSVFGPKVDKQGKVTWDCIYFGDYYQNFYEPIQTPPNPIDGKWYVDEDGTEMLYKEWFYYRTISEEELEASEAGEEITDRVQLKKSFLSKSPIKWRVLSREGNEVVLMSDSVLDVQPYHDECSWKECYLRNWLNTTFYNKAFTKTEQLAIKDTSLEEESLTDKVFLLSEKEATSEEFGFSEWDSLIDMNDFTWHTTEQNCSINTNYAQSVGEWSQYTESAENDIWAGNYDGITNRATWWLRPNVITVDDKKDPSFPYIWWGDSLYRIVNCKGKNNEACDGKKALMGVRPALHLNLAKSTWTSAEAIDQSGNVVSKDEIENVQDTAAEYGLNNPREIEGHGMTWDCIYFGNYPQNDTSGNATEPIKWRVLSVDGNDAFLIADKNLDAQPLDNTQITWETCSLRKWLNTTFLENAFSASEQKNIIQSKVKTDEGTDLGTDTLDSIYLLSYDEAKNSTYGFSTDIYYNSTAREGKKNDFVFSQYGRDGLINWWLRSSSIIKRKDDVNSFDATKYVYDEGQLSTGLLYDNYDRVSKNIGVRPVLRVNLEDSSAWEYAGQVTGDVKIFEESTPEPTQTPSVSYDAKLTNSTFTTSTANGQNNGNGEKPVKVKGLVIKKKKCKKITAKSRYDLSWKKVRNADGYEIQGYIISTYKGKKSKKKKILKTNKRNSIKRQKVKWNESFSSGKKKNYVTKIRVRAYKKVNGKKVYGSYSSWKAILSKKQVKKL